MKTKIILTWLLLLSLAITAKAQDRNLQIRSAPNGDLYVLGSFVGELVFDSGDTIGSPLNYGQHFLARLDSVGQLKWAKDINSLQSYYGYPPNFGELHCDNFNNVYISGNLGDSLIYDSTYHLYPDSLQAAFVAKIDSSAKLLYLKKSIGSSATGINIDTDSLGNVYLGGAFSGQSLSFDSLPPLNKESYNSDLFIAKFDSGGNAIWIQQIYGDSTSRNAEQGLGRIKVDNSGNVYFTGSFRGEFRDSLYFGKLSLRADRTYFEIFLGKCSASGNPLWFKKFDGRKGSNWIREMAVNERGDLVAAGSFRGNFLKASIKFDTLPVIETENQDLFLVQFDDLGNALWVRQASPDNDRDFNVPQGIATDPMNNIITFGEFTDKVVFPPLPPIERIWRDQFIVKLDWKGDAICMYDDSISDWTKRYTLRDLDNDPLGNTYTICGDGGYYGSDIVIAKWSKDCNLLWQTRFEHIIYTIGIEEALPEHLVKISPNPTTNRLILEIDEEIPGPISLELYDLSGKLLLKEAFEPSNRPKQLDLSNHENSVYILRILTEKGSLSKKIVKM